MPEKTFRQCLQSPQGLSPEDSQSMAAASLSAVPRRASSEAEATI